MYSPSFCYICVTNNPALCEKVKDVEFLTGTSLDVLRRGRALVHEGWELLASPLYGNFKPNQQPYRTLILRKNNDANGTPPDVQSLSLIEDAVRFYENAHFVMSPGGRAERIEKDFRCLDFVLLEETFVQYRLLAAPSKAFQEPAGRQDTRAATHQSQQ